MNNEYFLLYQLLLSEMKLKHKECGLSPGIEYLGIGGFHYAINPG